MYEILKNIHSWNRWLVLGFALVAIFGAFAGWLGRKHYTKQDRIIGGIFVGLAHLQLLTGLILYFFLSDLGLKAISANGMGVVMKNAGLRYWVIEHFTVMLLAAIIIQVGRTLSKKATSDLQKHKKSAIAFGIGFILIISRIPWDRVF